ncbi:hypothetical protein VN12_21165 [Pirellula sp. SH-Sr6A]|nr:hypothetical protein VN12_21165 [Pirellula sp. SH-Sr6A]
MGAFLLFLPPKGGCLLFTPQKVGACYSLLWVGASDLVIAFRCVLAPLRETSPPPKRCVSAIHSPKGGCLLFTLGACYTLSPQKVGVCYSLGACYSVT